MGFSVAAVILASLSPSVERSNAVYMCVAKSLELQKIADESFPEQASDRAVESIVARVKEKSDFQINSRGEFVIEFGPVAIPPPAKPYDLWCSGNWTKRVLTGVQIDRHLFKPKAGEEWPF
jgi:hypothetical protein